MVGGSSPYNYPKDVLSFLCLRFDLIRYPRPRAEITQDILKRAFVLCPELASPDIRVERKPTIDDVSPHIISEGCGFRPARKGGIRLEVEWTEGIGGRGRVPVIHNYG